MANILTHSFNGAEYVLVLSELCGKPIHYVRVVRVMEDGSKVHAFLSHRQHKAEARVKSYFAREIKKHMETAA